MPKIDLELACDLFLSCGAFSTTIRNLGKEKSYNEMWVDEPGEKRWEAWANPNNNVANVFIDPGSAFGTGTHSTTKLCLKWLSENIKGGESILDFGCGSGILSIAAIKLGCSSSIAVDIDPAALKVTKQNSLINNLSIPTYLPDKLPKNKYDILIANILSKPLIELLPKFQSLLKPGGYIAVSGILKSQIQNVKNLYNSYFNIIECKIEEEWGLISGYK